MILFVVGYHIDEMVRSIDTIDGESTPLMISLLGNNHLSNAEVQSMTAEFLVGGVDTVCIKPKIEWQFR